MKLVLVGHFLQLVGFVGELEHSNEYSGFTIEIVTVDYRDVCCDFGRAWLVDTNSHFDYI